jgi:hypothetical protein
MRKYLLIVAFLFTLFIAGCGEQDIIKSESPYIGGIGGMSIAFDPTAPLAEFTQDDVVDVKVNLVNKGEYAIPADSIKVKLYGLSPEEFNTLSFDYVNVPGGLFAAEKDIFDEGGQTLVNMGQIDYNGIVSNYIDRELYAKVCYPYETKASVETCITSRRAEEAGNDICDYTGEKIEDGFVSAGPIQITSFTQEPRGVNQMVFRVNLQNHGFGEAFSKDAECGVYETAVGKLQNEGKVFIKLAPLNVLCSFSNGQHNEGFVTLDGSEEKVLVCTMDVPEDSQYVQTVEVVANYNYVDSTSTNIKILGNQ